MSVEIDITAENIEPLLEELRTFPDKIQGRHLKPATNAATKVVLGEARRQSPRKNGIFRRSLTTVITQRGGTVIARVGQSKQPKQYKRKKITGSQINRKGFAVPIHFIEKGTQPHTIEAPKTPLRMGGNRRPNLLVGDLSLSGLKRTFRRRVKHPGTKPDAVLERSGRVAGPKAAIAFRDKLASRLKLGNA